MTFKIKVEKREDALQIALMGDLDINTSPELKVAVLEEYRQDPKNIVFNLEQLEYLDSTGLGVFISIYKNMKERNHTLTIQKPKAHIKKLFTITELDRIFNMEE